MLNRLRRASSALFQDKAGPVRAHGREPEQTAASALDEAERLVRDQRLTEAVDLLEGLGQSCSDAAADIRLRDLRHEAARSNTRGAGREPWPPDYGDPFPGLSGSVPEISSDDLSAEVMGGSVVHHGALCVRGLFDPGQVERVLVALHRARESQLDVEGRDERWFNPLAPGKAKLRENIRQRGGTWLADSPAATTIALAELRSSGVIGTISEHFGERPHFSLEKSTLRRTPPEEQVTGWHQDGSFLGSDVRTMNVWIALSTCGGRHPASGLEVVPHRLDELLPKDPALGNAGVSFDLMDEVLAERPSVQPEFEAGDAMIFDERFLHRTAAGPGLTEDRFALECWFFAPSHWTPHYTPLLV